MQKRTTQESGALLILYFLPLLSVESSYDLSPGAGGHQGIISFGWGVALLSNLALNLYLVSLVSWFAFGRKGGKAYRSYPLVGSFLVGLFLSYAYLFQSLGLRDTIFQSETHKLSDALYFVIMTFTTVGYGDVVPANRVGRLLAGFTAINSYVVLAMIVATLLPRIFEERGIRNGKVELNTN